MVSAGLSGGDCWRWMDGALLSGQSHYAEEADTSLKKCKEMFGVGKVSGLGMQN